MKAISSSSSSDFTRYCFAETEQRFPNLCGGSRQSSSAPTQVAQIVVPRSAARGNQVIIEQEDGSLVRLDLFRSVCHEGWKTPTMRGV